MFSVPIRTNDFSKVHVSSVRRLIGSISVSRVKKSEKQFSSELLYLKRNSAGQKKQNLMLIEGRNGIQEAIIAGLIPKSLYFSGNSSDIQQTLQLIPETSLSKLSLNKVSTSKMIEYSSFKTPPGLIGVFHRPDNSFVPPKRTPIYPVYTILDNVRNPENMGSILRTSAAAGCKAVLCSQGCVNPWNDKVTRTSMLANLYIETKSSMDWNSISEIIPKNTQILLANSKAASCNSQTSYLNWSYDRADVESAALILCNEGAGPSAGALEFCFKNNGTAVHVPMSQPIDSLNVSVAGAIILFHIVSQMKK